MHVFRPVVLVGAVFVVLALVLPFVTLPVAGAVDGIAGDAWPALIPIAPVVLNAALGDWRRGNSRWAAAVAIVLSCSGLLFAVRKLIDALEAVRAVEDGTLGPGAPVLVAALSVVVVGAALSLRRP